jgi:gas vesicle protein
MKKQSGSSSRFAPYKIPKKDDISDISDISDLMKKSTITEKRFKPSSVRKRAVDDQLSEMMKAVSLNDDEGQKELRKFAQEILDNAKNKK